MSSINTASQHQSFHLALLNDFCRAVRQQMPFCSTEINADDQAFLDLVEALPNQLNGSEDALFNGQHVICKIISSYSHIAPLIPRDLFWFFGGDCLHFMPDDEIANFQQLDELRFAAEDSATPFNYEEARAKIFGLH